MRINLISRLLTLIVVGSMSQSAFIGLVSATPQTSSQTQPSARMNDAPATSIEDWTQWRGPTRDGKLANIDWPASLAEDTLKTVWKVPLGPSYSGLCGVDLETGKSLWTQTIPTFRGMNIMTPTTFEGNLFASSYGGTTQMLNVSFDNQQFALTQKWNLPAQGYMTSPVVVDGHAYIHLKNQRLTCFDLTNGVEKWRSKPFGKYASLIASGDKILVMDQGGELMLIRANPENFELISSRKVGDDSWAHVAVRGNQIFIRNLDELVVMEWNNQAE